MGETGCGKTRLVKFMCALQVPPGADATNMVLMKVKFLKYLPWYIRERQGVVAWSVVMLLGMQATWRSIPTSSSFFREICHENISTFKKSSCQLMIKERMLSSGKLPLGGLPRNSATDRPNMTSDVYCGRKAANQTKKYQGTGL